MLRNTDCWLGLHAEGMKSVVVMVAVGGGRGEWASNRSKESPEHLQEKPVKGGDSNEAGRVKSRLNYKWP